MAMSVRNRPHFAIRAGTLADWIESQADKWWSVYGDPLLNSLLDFPCPSDELGPMVRKIGKDLLLQDRNADPAAGGRFVENISELDSLCDSNNWRHHRTLLLTWADSETDWILSEAEALVDK